MYNYVFKVVLALLYHTLFVKLLLRIGDEGERFIMSDTKLDYMVVLNGVVIKISH